MLCRLEVPYLDASAAQLVWRLGAAPRTGLASLAVGPAIGGLRVELRLLGASHQVLVRDGDGVVRCSEVVACDTEGSPGDLPPLVRRRLGGLDYGFTSAVSVVAPHELAEAAAGLRHRLGGARSTAIVGAFPGSPDAVTAIEARPSGWSTWHLYPQSREVVTTTTVLEARP